MLQKIKQYTVRGASSVTALIVFVIMLPLTLAMTLFMLIAGMAAMATIRYRLRKSGINAELHGAPEATTHQPSDYTQKAPIEGSYTVVEK